MVSLNVSHTSVVGRRLCSEDDVAEDFDAWCSLT